MVDGDDGGEEGGGLSWRRHFLFFLVFFATKIMMMLMKRFRSESVVHVHVCSTEMKPSFYAKRSWWGTMTCK